MFRRKLKRRIEALVLIKSEGDKNKISRESLYEEGRVVEREQGKEREDGTYVRCEDATRTLFAHGHCHARTDALTQERFYTQRPLSTTIFARRRLYTHT